MSNGLFILQYDLLDDHATWIFQLHNLRIFFLLMKWHCWTKGEEKRSRILDLPKRFQLDEPSSFYQQIPPTDRNTLPNPQHKKVVQHFSKPHTRNWLPKWQQQLSYSPYRISCTRLIINMNAASIVKLPSVVKICRILVEWRLTGNKHAFMLSII